jgi:pyruvate dehydrogenase E2 component (dihydrolipoamide acetyltransferase)/2-oxoisovalerate dehydrogenase E2 component (dihydrolipoyl transacylase)
MDFNLPELGEGVYEAEAVRWLVQPGETVKPGQTLLEALTDKATMEVPAPFAGVIQELLIEPGAKLKIGQPILRYEDKKGAAVKATPKADKESKPKPPLPVADVGNGVVPTAVKAAPSVRLMARKLGIDLLQIRGSGPAGRILIDDLSEHLGSAVKPAPPPADFGTPGTRIKFAGLRRKIAEHMVLAKHTIPHYTYVDECDVSPLVALREALKEPIARKGAKLTYLAFFVRAVAAALKEVPIVNASLDEKTEEIVLHDKYHIGIAVATPGGLVVPVVHDADKKSLLDIAAQVEQLSNDARQGKLKLDDLRGGTFTITSIGNIGGLIATPIINHPEVGILGIGKIVKRPVFDEHGQVKAADMLYLSFSFDHRVLDGAIGAAFGNAVIKHLQNPAAMLV